MVSPLSSQTERGACEGSGSCSLLNAAMRMALKPGSPVPAHSWACLVIFNTGSGLSELIYFSLFQ